MHIILVSNRLATAKSVTVTRRTLMAATSGLVAAVLLLSVLFSYLAVRHAASIDLPLLREIAQGGQRAPQGESASEGLMTANLKAMAMKVGELQARLLRLQWLGNRVATTLGVKAEEPAPVMASLQTVAAQSSEGRGGPLLKADTLSEAQLQDALDAISKQVDMNAVTLTLLDSRAFDDRVRKNLMPTILPVATQWNSSSFGWRDDPITGERSMHEGVDFPADPGTPIVAAAAGIVVSATFRPDYGNVIEIDHGNDLSTRYAHCSRLFVKTGSMVMRGQKIAEVGDTGRSTGPHLHFEVRYRGIAQNPNRFLEQARNSPPHLARQ